MRQGEVLRARGGYKIFNARNAKKPQSRAKISPKTITGVRGDDGNGNVL